MNFRISPLWWPFLALSSPLVLPWLFVRNRGFRNNSLRAEESNKRRIKQAGMLELPELEFLELTVIVEWQAKKGFIGDAFNSKTLLSSRYC